MARHKSVMKILLNAAVALLLLASSATSSVGWSELQAGDEAWDGEDVGWDHSEAVSLPRALLQDASDLGGYVEKSGQLGSSNPLLGGYYSASGAPKPKKAKKARRKPKKKPKKKPSKGKKPSKKGEKKTSKKGKMKVKKSPPKKRAHSKKKTTSKHKGKKSSSKKTSEKQLEKIITHLKPLKPTDPPLKEGDAVDDLSEDITNRTGR